MAATLNAGKHFRSWKNVDSLDRSDVERLFDGEKVKTTKSVNCFKYWTVYCTLIGFFFLFLIGILVGFLLRGDTKVTSGCERKDGFDREKLQAVHNNIVYFMSEENIKTSARELSALSSSSSKNIDRVTALYVEKKFRQYGFDDVEVEQQEIVVTSPDPLHPNRLEILSPEGITRKNITLGNFAETRKGGNLDDPGGFVEFSPGGKVKGPLVYGNYGRDVDFLQLEASHVEMQDSVILLRLGRGTVADKVKLAQRHGCGGMLLFCYHGDQCNYDDTVPVVRDFTDLDEDGLPTIPVQTVPHSVAMDLISSIPGTSLQPHWFQGSRKQVNGSTGEATPNVYLEVNNQKSSYTIYNVIATLYGGQESDQQVILGSRRYASESDLDPDINTGTLLELGRSMAYISERELWKPRRTVKCVSYGGHRKDIGLFYYIKNYRHLLSQGAVAYIGLDSKSTRLKSMEFRSSPSLVNLIWRAADMVPDPSNPEYSLAEIWPKKSPDWYLSNESAVYMYSSGEMSLLQHLGIPSVSLYSVQSLLGRDNEGKLLQGDISRTSYQLASARVISLTTLKLLDDVILPVNLSFLLQFVNHSISSSLEVLKQHISGLEDKIGKVIALSGTLAHVASGSQLFSSDCTKARQINHVLIGFESLFQTESSDEGLLSLERQTGIMSVFSEVEERYLITNDRDMVSKILDIFLQVLKEALQEVSAIKTR